MGNITNRMSAPQRRGGLPSPLEYVQRGNLPYIDPTISWTEKRRQGGYDWRNPQQPVQPQPVQQPANPYAGKSLSELLQMRNQMQQPVQQQQQQWTGVLPPSQFAPASPIGFNWQRGSLGIPGANFRGDATTQDFMNRGGILGQQPRTNYGQSTNPGAASVNTASRLNTNAFAQPRSYMTSLFGRR